MKYPQEFVDKFWSKVDKTGNCWQWKGGVTMYGYGQIMHNHKTLRVHRVAYQLCKSEIPEGLTLDHLCRNRLCVNPDHLEAVTSKVNLLRGNGMPAQNARKTHCKRGHELKGKNVYYIKNGKGRACNVCHTEQQRLRRKHAKLDELMERLGL